MHWTPLFRLALAWAFAARVAALEVNNSPLPSRATNVVPRWAAPTHFLTKRQANQIPIAACPEEIGLDVSPCSSCGGENPQRLGYCLSPLAGSKDVKNCRCKNDVVSSSLPPLPTTVSSAGVRLASTVVDGQTVTATFTATTLSEYRSLRSHTIATTTTTEKDGKETEIAVAVFAAGVAWWLTGLSAGAAPLLIQPPLDNPNGDEGQKDDEVCDPEPECSDPNCGGATEQGLCKSGEKAGCPCEDKEPKCPEEPPQCSMDDCAGDENTLKCSKEEIKDCQCCPKELACDDEDCHPGDNDDNCTGEKFKGCTCARTLAPWPNVQPLQSPLSQADIDRVAEDVFQRFFHGNKAELGIDDTDVDIGTNSTEPVCNKNTNWGVDPAVANSMAGKFCEGDLTKNLSMEFDGKGQSPPVDLDGVQVSFKFEHAEGQCDRNCVDSYSDMIQRCQFNSHTFTGGASIDDGCGRYTLQVVDGDDGVSYSPGICSAKVQQDKGYMYQGLVVYDIKDNNGRKIGDDSSYFPIATKDAPVSITSRLPFLLQVWRRKNNEGMEFRYGKDAWSTDSKWQKDTGAPRLSKLQRKIDGKCEKWWLSASNCRVAEIFWNCPAP